MPLEHLRDDTAIEGQCLTMIHSELVPFCHDMVEIQTRLSAPNANEDAIRELADVFQRLRQLEAGTPVEFQPGDTMTSRESALAYTRALIELERIDFKASHAAGENFQPYDPGALLDAYYDARHAARETCPTIDQIHDPALLRTDAYLPIEAICENLQSHEAQVQSRIHFMNWIPAYKPDDVVYASVAFVNNTLRRSEALEGYETFYSMTDYTAGYQFMLHGKPWLEGSGPIAEVALSHIAGAVQNNGSRATELALRGGWWQRLPYSFFIESEISLGHAWHELNYGEGLVPEKGRSLMLGASGIVGYSLPIPTIFTVDISAGYFLEGAITNEHYLNYGPMIQVAPKLRWPF